MTENTLSVVLPCYNESKNIPAILQKFAQVRDNLPIELVLVDNGSTDDSAQTLSFELAKPQYRFARFVRVEKNRGYGYGIMSGLSTCKEEFLAYSHADLQCDPADIIRAYQELLHYPDQKMTLIKGERKGRSSIVSELFRLLASVLFMKNFNDINGQPKVFHSSFMQKLASPPDDFTFDFYVQYVALKNGMSVVPIGVEFHKRQHGTSSWASSVGSRISTMLGFVAYMIKLRLSG